MYIVVFGTNSHVCGSYRGKTGTGGGGGGGGGAPPPPPPPPPPPLHPE